MWGYECAALYFGRGPGPSSTQRQRGLTLLNPSLAESEPQSIFLQRRNKFVNVRVGDTHHHIAGGQSRAIQLVLATTGVAATVVIHNSLHCSLERKCPFYNCQEYTLGDHFLLEVEVVDKFETGRGDML